MLTVTDRAARKIADLIEREGKPQHGLRIGVVGGGCSGLQYHLAFEEESTEGDRIFEANGVKVFVDPKSYLYLVGIELDYVDGLTGGGFRINNPNASRSCGCGESFSV